MLKELTALQKTKIAFMPFCLLLLVSIVLSCWWLRPLTWDGGRYGFLLVHNGVYYFDEVRLSQVFFQTPALLLQNHLSPRSMIRLYFLTLLLCIYGVQIFRLYREKDTTKLTLSLFLVFVGLLPGLSFSISSMPDTVIFFFLFQDYLQDRESKLGFYISGILTATGHPGFIIAFGLLGILMFIDTKVTQRKFSNTQISFFLLCFVINGFLFIKSTIVTPGGVSGHWSRVVNYYFGHLTETDLGHMSIAILSSALMFSNLLKSRTIIQFSLAAFIIYLLLNSNGESSIQKMSHGYRVFTFGVILVTFFLSWIHRWRKIEISRVTVATLFILAGTYLFWDFHILSGYKKTYSYFEALSPDGKCSELAPDRDISSYTVMSFPIFKIFIDNRTVIDHLVFDRRFFKKKNACDLVVHEKEGQTIIPTIPPFILWISNNGKFQFK